jgi:hypothetical protein
MAADFDSLPTSRVRTQGRRRKNLRDQHSSAALVTSARSPHSMPAREGHARAGVGFQRLARLSLRRRQVQDDRSRRPRPPYCTAMDADADAGDVALKRTRAAHLLLFRVSQQARRRARPPRRQPIAASPAKPASAKAHVDGSGTAAPVRSVVTVTLIE